MLNIENNFGQTFPKRGSIIVKRAQRSERSFVLNVCMVKISGNLDLGRLNSPYISESIRYNYENYTLYNYTLYYTIIPCIITARNLKQKVPENREQNYIRFSDQLMRV